MQEIIVIRGAGKQGLHTEDDGGGTEFQGETERTGVLPGVQEGTGEGVTGGALPNPERRGEGGVEEGVQQESRWKQAQELQDLVS